MFESLNMPKFDRDWLDKLLRGHRLLREKLMTKRYDEDDFDEDNEYDPQYVQWGSSDGSIFLPASKTVKELPPGCYEINYNSQMGLFFEKIPVKTEGLIKFPDTTSNKVIGEIQNFWDRQEFFERYGIAYKRGIILYGPPGSGKSCAVQLAMRDVIERKGICLNFYDPSLFIDGLRALRKIQPQTPVVAVMEDIDSLIEENSETAILNILDGVNEVHKVVFLATTNYPNKLGHRVMNRPSRFDKRFRIGFPSAVSRKAYFEHLMDKETISGVDLDKWVKDTDKLSIAHLKELFVAVVILGDSYKESLKTLKAMKEDVEDKDFEGKFGFGNDGDEEELDDFYD